MKDGDGNMMPVWFEGDCLPNILIIDDDLPNNEESDNDDFEDDETAADETDDADVDTKFDTVTVPDTNWYDYWMLHMSMHDHNTEYICRQVADLSRKKCKLFKDKRSEFYH